MRSTGVRRWERLRRLRDIAGAVSGLVVTAPAQVVIAAWIVAVDGRPVLYKGTRVGRDGRNFEILKFRTMTIGADRGGSITRSGDPRVTKPGAFLRAWKLDELPQLVNVLRGEMSLVGPRPETPDYVALYEPEIRSVLLSARPGITDPASIAYRHEGDWLVDGESAEWVYLQEIMPQKNRISAAYVMRGTVWTDCVVLGRTFASLFTRANLEPQLATR